MQDTNHRAPFASIKRVQAALLFLILALFAMPAKGADHDKGSVRIKNFGQVDEQLYRGSQPKDRDFQALAAMGIKTVINLRDDNVEEEQEQVTAAGMHYVNIPIHDKTNPSDRQNSEFLRLINDKANGPYYVHCAGGRHRTGVMVAIYRMNNYQWDIDRAYAEMKDFDFYTSMGHGGMKDYVFNYYKQMHRSPVSNQNDARAINGNQPMPAINGGN